MTEDRCSAEEKAPDMTPFLPPGANHPPKKAARTRHSPCQAAGPSAAPGGRHPRDPATRRPPGTGPQPGRRTVTRHHVGQTDPPPGRHHAAEFLRAQVKPLPVRHKRFKDLYFSERVVVTVSGPVTVTGDLEIGTRGSVVGHFELSCAPRVAPDPIASSARPARPRSTRPAGSCDKTSLIRAVTTHNNENTLEAGRGPVRGVTVAPFSPLVHCGRRGGPVKRLTPAGHHA
jgi:hypothetical protein